MINLDKTCMVTYLVIGGAMLTYADSIPKIIISGVILSIGATMYYIIYIKKERLTGDLNE